jgi:AcrR family transcriptional regulator
MPSAGLRDKRKLSRACRCPAERIGLNRSTRLKLGPLMSPSQAKPAATKVVKKRTLVGAQAETKTTKSAMRRDAILIAAAELFDRQGYVNTSLDDVARAVGIKREALYYYYRNRSEILLAIIGPQAQALVDGLHEILEGPASAPDKLRLGIQNHLQRFDRYCLEMTISLRDGLLETSEEVRTVMARTWKTYERMWIELIAQGQKQGEFRDADPKMVAFGVLGMCNWLARWYDPKKGEPLDSIIETFFVLVGYGLVTQECRPPEAAGLQASIAKKFTLT